MSPHESPEPGKHFVFHFAPKGTNVESEPSEKMQDKQLTSVVFISPNNVVELQLDHDTSKFEGIKD